MNQEVEPARNPFEVYNASGEYQGELVGAIDRIARIQTWNLQQVQDAWRWWHTAPARVWQDVVVRSLRTRERKLIRERLATNRGNMILHQGFLPGMPEAELEKPY